jgi:hypothetical protein
MQYWLFGLPIGKQPFGETSPTFCRVEDFDPVVVLRFIAGLYITPLRANRYSVYP